MRGTALLVAAVVALGIAAAVDALRSDDGGEPPPGSATSSTSPQAELRRADVTGMLYFAVRNPCEVRGVRLPDLSNAVSFTSEFCRFDVDSAGAVVEGPRCPGDGVRVQRMGERTRGFPGCAPAWRPNGDLTFVLDGDVVTADGETLVDDIASFARSMFPPRSSAYVRELAWLSDTRLAIVVRGDRIESELRDVVVLLEDGRRLQGGQLNASRLDVSQQMQQIFVAYPGGGLVVYNRRGVAVSTESRFPFPDISAATASPDGRFVALARPGNLCIYEEIEPPPRERFPVTCLPFDVVDLAWR